DPAVAVLIEATRSRSSFEPMKALHFALPLVAVVLGTAATAEAGPRWRRHARAVHPADVNHDGVVTRGEMKRFHRLEARAASRRLDQNCDGWISSREFRRAKVRGYPRADFDLDGRVTPFERDLARQARFEGIPVELLMRKEAREARQAFRQLDHNRDGRIGRREARFASSDALAYQPPYRSHRNWRR
ncbi:MAG: EF-hand domain-containing protein, partial [Myxococcota bacterium]